MLPRRAHGAAWHAERHHRRVEREVRHEGGRELVGRSCACRRERLSPFAVGHEVIAPRDQLARCVDAGLQVVEAARPVEVVRHVVFARPQQLHGLPADLGDPRGFDT